MGKLDLRARTCCFTGHRVLPEHELPMIRARTERVICSLIQEKEVRFFGVGGAVGYDTLAAEVLFQLRETHYPHIKVLNIALPDAYVEHGNVSKLREALGIDSDSVVKKMKAFFGGSDERTS